MRRNTSKTSQLIKVCVLLMAVTLASFVFPQSKPLLGTPPSQTQQLYQITIVHVQIGAGNEWENLIKTEYVPAMKKAGVTQLTVLKTATLGENGEYFLARPIKDIAELGEPTPLVKALGQDGSNALSAKLSRITRDMHSSLITARPDLGITPASGYVLKMVNASRVSVAPGRTADFEKSTQAMQPVLGKTNIKGRLVAKVGMGGNPNEYLVFNLFDSFADLSQFGPAVRKAIDEAKLSPPQPGIVIHEQRTLYSRIPELSIQQPAQKPAK